MGHATGLESVCGADIWCNRHCAASRADRAGDPELVVFGRLFGFLLFLGGGGLGGALVAKLMPEFRPASFPSWMNDRR